MVPLYDQLDCEEEYKKLVSILKQTQHLIRLTKTPLNFESFKQVLARKPKMIHISCHGDYDQKLKEFYLQFEQSGTGILDKVNQSRLKDLIGSDGQNIQIAFISSCHSEQIGEIFYQAGIPIVICVNQDSMILNDICILFMRHFYMQLINGRTVKQAFEEAQATVRASETNYKSCCCAHSHSNQCIWFKYAKQHGFEQAHAHHAKGCNCHLRGNLHNPNCQVKQEFTSFLTDISKMKSMQSDIPTPHAKITSNDISKDFFSQA